MCQRRLVEYAHVGQHQVLEARGASRRAGLVVVLERLEEIGVRLLELILAKVHLATALANHTHDQRMGNRRFDVQRLLVQCLQFLVVLLRRVHLDLQCVDLQQLGALLQVVLALVVLSSASNGG